MAASATVSACEVICDALELLEQNEWVQGSEKTTVKGKPAYCMWGAYKEVARRRQLRGPEATLLEDLVVLHIGAAITPGATSTDNRVVMQYNDAKGRTKAEVLDVLRRAGTCPST